MQAQKDSFLPYKLLSRRAMDKYEAYAALVKGITEMKFEGDPQPCILTLTGDNVLPIAVSTRGDVLVAAAVYGKGRIVVTAHETYMQDFSFLTPDGQFIKNAIEWLMPYTHAWVGVYGTSDLNKDNLSGISVKSLSNYDRTVGVCCRNAYNDTQVEDLLDFVRGGGGLLIGGQAWYWSSTHRGVDVSEEFPGNKLTGPAGIFFTNQYGEKGTFPIPCELPLNIQP
ncbi:hypothetical protein AAFF_G00323890 [Aldrovandia affinis]|uniref:Uncharacterized protein n=1 Tax=Aldrovandia affinis TaxID=143900 RepID=A0AAD7R6S6_9TELE|nr:hypothetical protein AAFF_G00323890 [Aldrovandia affinis]